MKVALPIWDQRVSPVFDVAGRLRVVEVEEGSLVDQIDHRIAPGLHVSLLSELRVEVLICSAISRALETAVRGAGVDVIPDICGDVDEIVQAYVLGNLGDRRFACPRHSKKRSRGRSERTGTRNIQESGGLRTIRAPTHKA